jgi:hypothetical protein
MSASTVKCSLSEGMAQNRYLPIGYQLWVLYGEWDCNLPLPHRVAIYPLV